MPRRAQEKWTPLLQLRYFRESSKADILRRLADNPLIARREVLAAIERDKEGKAVRAANKSVGDAMKSASGEIGALADEARTMRGASVELESQKNERSHVSTVKSDHEHD